MKYLQDYREKPQTKLFERTGAIFAFTTEVFNEQKVDDVKYVNMGHGLICPEGNIVTLINGLDEINKIAIAQDIADNGKERIIRRELDNHECFYTGEISDAVRELKQYGYTEDEVYKMFRNKNHKFT